MPIYNGMFDRINQLFWIHASVTSIRNSDWVNLILAMEINNIVFIQKCSQLNKEPLDYNRISSTSSVSQLQTIQLYHFWKTWIQFTQIKQSPFRMKYIFCQSSVLWLYFTIKSQYIHTNETNNLKPSRRHQYVWSSLGTTQSFSTEILTTATPKLDQGGKIWDNIVTGFYQDSTLLSHIWGRHLRKAIRKIHQETSSIPPRGGKREAHVKLWWNLVIEWGVFSHTFGRSRDNGGGSLHEPLADMINPRLHKSIMKISMKD